MIPLYILLGCTGAFIFFEIFYIGWHFAISKRLTDSITAFNQYEAKAKKRILFVGDSTGFGTGASESRYSLMGRFSADMPQAHIENYSRIRRKLRGAIQILEEQLHSDTAPFDAVIIMVGGMNVVHFTPLFIVEKLLRRVIALSKQCGKSVVLIAPYNCGLAPLYHVPLAELFQWRLAKAAELYERIAHEEGIFFVSLYESEQDALSRSHCYALDKVHPNDEGYGLWYDRIKPTLYQALGTVS